MAHRFQPSLRCLLCRLKAKHLAAGEHGCVTVDPTSIILHPNSTETLQVSFASGRVDARLEQQLVLALNSSDTVMHVPITATVHRPRLALLSCQQGGAEWVEVAAGGTVTCDEVMQPGETTQLRFVLRNVGSVTARFQLSGSVPGVAIVPLEGPLAPDQEQEVVVSYTAQPTTVPASRLQEQQAALSLQFCRGLPPLRFNMAFRVGRPALRASGGGLIVFAASAKPELQACWRDGAFQGLGGLLQLSNDGALPITVKLGQAAAAVVDCADLPLTLQPGSDSLPARFSLPLQSVLRLMGDAAAGERRFALRLETDDASRRQAEVECVLRIRQPNVHAAMDRIAFGTCSAGTTLRRRFAISNNGAQTSAAQVCFQLQTQGSPAAAGGSSTGPSLRSVLLRGSGGSGHSFTLKTLSWLRDKTLSWADPAADSPPALVLRPGDRLELELELHVPKGYKGPAHISDHLLVKVLNQVDLGTGG